GIRDFHVTGVQTCALPILTCLSWSRQKKGRPPRVGGRELYGGCTGAGAGYWSLRVSTTVSATLRMVSLRSMEFFWIHRNASGSLRPYFFCSSPLARSTKIGRAHVVQGRSGGRGRWRTGSPGSSRA